MAAPTLEARAHSGPSYTTLLDSTYGPVQELIRKGDQGMTAVNSIDVGTIGWAAIDALNRYFNGTPPAPEGVGFRMIDKEHGVPASGGYVSSTDYKSLFMKAWEEGAEQPTK